LIRGRSESVLGVVAAARGQWARAEARLAIADEAAVGSPSTPWAELLARDPGQWRRPRRDELSYAPSHPSRR